MKVLYVSHTATVGGGERSLLDLVDTLPPEIDVVIATPRGELAAAAAERGVDVVPIPGIESSLRVAGRQLPRDVVGLAASLRAVRHTARATGATIVHANSIRAGLISAAVRQPLLVHVRDVLPPGALASLASSVVRRRAAAVLANSGYTAERFGGSPMVISPWVDPDRFDPAKVGRAAARRALGAPEGDPLLGVVGQITPWKGQLEAVETLAAVRRTHPEARLVLCGSVRFDGRTRHDNRTYESELHQRVDERGLGGSVIFLGERADVETVLRALDVLLVPSWEEPFGRVVLEGMAAAVPVVVTATGGCASTVEDGVTGFVLPPRSPDRWADLVAGLLSDEERMAAIGDAARARVATSFTREAGLRSVLRAYSAVTNR